MLPLAPLLVRGTPGSDPIRVDGEDRQVVLPDDLGVAGVPCAGAPLHMQHLRKENGAHEKAIRRGRYSSRLPRRLITTPRSPHSNRRS